MSKGTANSFLFSTQVNLHDLSFRKAFLLFKKCIRTQYGKEHERMGEI